MGPNPVFQTLVFCFRSSEQLLHKHLWHPSPERLKALGNQAVFEPEWVRGAQRNGCRNSLEKRGLEKQGLALLGNLSQHMLKHMGGLSLRSACPRRSLMRMQPPGVNMLFTPYFAFTSMAQARSVCVEAPANPLSEDHCLPSDTKLLLPKNYSEITIFAKFVKITNFTRNS